MTNNLLREKILHYHQYQMSEALQYLASFDSSKLPTLSREKRIFSISSADRTADQTQLRLDLSGIDECKILSQRKHSQRQSALQSARLSAMKTTSRHHGQESTSNKSLHLSKFITAKKIKDQVIQQGHLYSDWQQLSYFEDQQLSFLEVVRKRDFDRMILLFEPMIVRQQQINSKRSLENFMETILFLANFAIKIDQYSKGVFFLKDLLAISEFTQFYSMKIRTLIALSQCARHYKSYKQAVLLLEKALHYSWACNYHDFEIQLLDLIGLCYFYMGNTYSADYYHTKWANGDIEGPNSKLRQGAKEFMHMYEKTLLSINKFCQALSSQLHLPFRDILNTRYDDGKLVRYDNCHGQPLLDEILCSLDFTEFHLEAHEQIPQSRKQVPRNSLPRSVVEIQMKYRNNREMYNFDHKIHENPLYKLSISEMVAHRRKQSYSLDAVHASVRKQIAELREPFVRSEQIYVKHLNENKPQSLDIFIKLNKEVFIDYLVKISIL